MTLAELLRRCDRRYGEEFRNATPKGGLTRQRMLALAAIEERPSTSQTVLCDAMGIDRSTLSTMLLGLEHEGLIWRERGGADLRLRSVQITANGRRALRQAQKIDRIAEDIMLTGLLPKHRQALVQYLGEIARA